MYEGLYENGEHKFSFFFSQQNETTIKLEPCIGIEITRGGVKKRGR